MSTCLKYHLNTFKCSLLPLRSLIVLKTTTGLVRASMDGSSQLFLQVDRQQPGIGVDLKDSKLFLATDDGKMWSGYYKKFAFGLRLYDGIAGEVKSIAVIGDTIYWSDGRIVRTFNKTTLPGMRVILTEIIALDVEKGSASDMLVFHSSAQPRKRINHCARGALCSDFCVLTENYFTCLGPERFQVSSNGYTCAFKGGETSKPGAHIRKAAHFPNCGNNYTCSNGACMNYTRVCDGNIDCDDCSDEGPSN